MRLLALLLVCLVLPVRALTLTPMAGELRHPWGLAFLPDGGYLVSERPGRLLRIDAGGNRHVVSGLPPLGALTITMVVAMLLTPFLNNAATVLVVGPIAAALAQRLGLNPDPFLMAVAVGAACDFLTPIGHQCNTLVMGPGGYRFGDYARLGLPLSVLVVLTGMPLIAWFWPLGPG